MLDAQKSGDGQDARKILAAANEMGAITTVDFARWSRELDNLRAVTALDKTGEKPGKTDLPAGFHQMTTRAGEGEKFVNYAPGWGGKGECDVVVSFPKDGEGKGDKTFVSEKSGVAFTLKGVVDVTERKLVEQEAKLQNDVAYVKKMAADIAKDRETLEAIIAEGAGENGENAEKIAQAQTDLETIKAQEKTCEENLSVMGANLEAVTQDIWKTQVDKWKSGEANLKRENDAREAIGFVGTNSFVQLLPVQVAIV